MICNLAQIAIDKGGSNIFAETQRNTRWYKHRDIGVMLNRCRHFGAMCHGRKSRLFNLRENQRYNVFPVDLGVPPPSRRKLRGRRVTLQPQRDMSCEMGTLRVTHAIEKKFADE